MKRLLLLLQCVVVCCFAFYLSEGKGNAASKQASIDGPTVIAKALEQAGDVANPANQAVVLAQIAKTYLQMGLYDEALKVSQTVSDPYTRALLLLELARLNSEKGPQEQTASFMGKTMETIDKTRNPDQQVFAWMKVAKVCGAMPELKETGLKSLALATEKTAKIRDTQLRAARMTTIAGLNMAYGQETDALELLDGALEISKEMEDAQDGITVLDHIALGYLRAGKAETALEIIADIEDLYTAAAAYDRMVDYYASIGQFKKAAETAAAIERPYTRAFTLSRLAMAKEQAGGLGVVDLLKRAWMDAEKVENDFLQSNAMAQVADSRSAIGQVEAALALTELIPDEIVKAVTLKKIAAGFAREGQYNRAVEVVDGIAHPYNQASALIRLTEIAQVGLGGDHEDAKKWLIRAEKITAEIEDIYLQQAARVSIVDSFAALGEYDQAVNLADLIEDRYHFATALYHVTHQYILQKQYAEAMDMAAAIDDAYYRASALTEVAAALHEHGPITFENDPNSNTWAFGKRNNIWKQVEIETAFGHALNISNATLETPVSALISFAVAENETGPFTGGTLIASNSSSKKKNVLEIGENVEMKEAMDDVFKVLNTLKNTQEIDTQGKQQQFLVYLSNVHYGNHHSRYFGANDFQGKQLEDPYLPELEGKDLSDFPDANSNEPFLLFMRAGVKKGQGVVSHMWPKNELKNKSYPRISLVRIFEPWEWDVVTSFTPATIEDYDLYDTIIDDRKSASPI